jgi:hypothetical protein
VKTTRKTDSESVLAARVKGMQLFIETFAPEERCEVEYFSDSPPQYSPLIKRQADMETSSPSMDQRTTRLQTKRLTYTIPSPICPDHSVDNGQTKSLLGATPKMSPRRSAPRRFTSN